VVVGELVYGVRKIWYRLCGVLCSRKSVKVRPCISWCLDDGISMNNIFFYQKAFKCVRMEGWKVKGVRVEDNKRTQ
jgi:hypothetical protein